MASPPICYILLLYVLLYKQNIHIMTEEKKPAKKAIWVKPETHKKVKVKAAKEGKTSAEVVEELLTEKAKTNE